MKEGLSLIQKYFPEISDHQKEQFIKLGLIYPEWNSRINVISRKDIEHLYEHHVLHSLGIAKVTDFIAETKILDVGTGGGFPGIPLAILYPECKFHLVDSIRKKVKVAQEVIIELGLNNAIAEQNRVEQLTEKYDFAVSRAVTDLVTVMGWLKGRFLEKSNNKLKNGLIYLKGGQIDSAIPTKNRYELNNYFEEEFFDHKLVIHLPSFFSFSQKK